MPWLCSRHCWTWEPMNPTTPYYSLLLPTTDRLRSGLGRSVHLLGSSTLNNIQIFHSIDCDLPILGRIERTFSSSAPVTEPEKSIAKRGRVRRYSGSGSNKP